MDLLPCVQISGSSILADKAYDAKEIHDYVTGQNAVYTIPPKENCANPWPCDFHTYEERHLVERFFHKLKIFRGLPP